MGQANQLTYVRKSELHPLRHINEQRSLSQPMRGAVADDAARATDGAAAADSGAAGAAFVAETVLAVAAEEDWTMNPGPGVERVPAIATTVRDTNFARCEMVPQVWEVDMIDEIRCGDSGLAIHLRDGRVFKGCGPVKLIQAWSPITKKKS